MSRTIILNRNLINFGIPFGLLAILILLIRAPFLIGNDTLNLAVSIDLLLTVPLVYYLLIRKSKVPKTTTIPVMVAGLLIGSFFLPKESQTYLNLFKNWALPVMELSVLIFVLTKARKANNSYQALKHTKTDFYDRLKAVCREILPNKLVLPFATEIAVFYYGFIKWKKREINQHEFTHHQKSGTPSLLGAFILVLAIETFALHALLAPWNLLVAWVLTGLSTYTSVQVLGFAKALTQRPISIENNTLFLRYGIMNESQIPITDIESVVLSKKELEKDKLTKTLSPLGGLESHNVLIHLKRANTLIGLYGIKREVKLLALHMDEPENFKEYLEKTLH